MSTVSLSDNSKVSFLCLSFGSSSNIFHFYFSFIFIFFLIFLIFFFLKGEELVLKIPQKELFSYIIEKVTFSIFFLIIFIF